MNNQELLSRIVKQVGGKENIRTATHCMTRLRLKLHDSTVVVVDELKGIEGVLGVVQDETLQIVVGPGKSKKLCDLLIESYGVAEGSLDWEQQKKEVKANQKQTALKKVARLISNIFIPLIPAIIAAGLLTGFANLIGQFQNQGVISADPTSLWTLVRLVFSLLGTSFLGYFSIYAGINAAKQFGATEALGGMIGALSIAAGVIDISKFFNWYNIDIPGNSLLTTGKGGLIGVIFGVWLLSVIEKKLRKIIPDSLDMIATPVLSILITGILFVLVVMPASGVVSDGVNTFLNFFANSPNQLVRIITGYIVAATFLPLVLFGLHHGVVAIYAVQLEKLGGVTLSAVTTQAGAGQVGAAIAIYFKAKKMRHTALKEAVLAGLPSGFLGISEPLMYGVTLPIGKAFVTAGLGAGFGGAFIMAMNVMAVSWGPTGLVAAPLMVAGPNGAMGIVYFLCGLCISYIMGFIMTYLFVTEADIANLMR